MLETLTAVVLVIDSFLSSFLHEVDFSHPSPIMTRLGLWLVQLIQGIDFRF